MQVIRIKWAKSFLVSQNFNLSRSSVSIMTYYKEQAHHVYSQAPLIILVWLEKQIMYYSMLFPYNAETTLHQSYTIIITHWTESRNYKTRAGLSNFVVLQSYLFKTKPWVFPNEKTFCTPKLGEPPSHPPKTLRYYLTFFDRERVQKLIPRR